MFSGPEDIYDVLVEKSEDSWILGLVAFAVIEEQRIEWMKHQNENNGGFPSPEEIKTWYQQQPNSILLRARDTAEARLKDYSNEIVDTVLEDQVEDIKQGIIVGEIRDIKRFWPQFGVNLAGGFVSSLLFALLLVALAIILLNSTSPGEIAAQLKTKMEVADNVKK